MILHCDTDEYQQALAICRMDHPDLQSAFDLLNQAEKKGDQRAAYALASWYLSGNDLIEKDEKKGVNILKKLKNSYIAEALFNLGVSYDYGKFVKKDQEKAFFFYMRAALLGDSLSCDQVSQFYREGRVVPYSEDLSEAWRLRSTQLEKDISPPYRLKLA